MWPDGRKTQYPVHEILDGATVRILFVHEKPLHQPAEDTGSMHYNTNLAKQKERGKV